MSWPLHRTRAVRALTRLGAARGGASRRSKAIVAGRRLPEPARGACAAPLPNPLLSDKLLDAKVRLHRRLIEEINLSALEKLPEEEMREHIQQLVTQYILVERLALNTQELNDFVSEILDEMTGLGPLEPLLKDATISDILINGHECVYVERARPARAAWPCRFKDEAHLLRIINKIVSAVGRRVDESHPLVRRAPARRLAASTSRCGRSASTARWCRSASSPRSRSTSTSWSRSAQSSRRWPNCLPPR